MQFPPIPTAKPGQPAQQAPDFRMNSVYQAMTAETIGKLPEKQAREAITSVKTVKLELFRTALRTMTTSTLITFMAQHDLLMTEMFHGGAPKYSEYESTMIIAAARVALTTEIDRRIPIPK